MPVLAAVDEDHASAGRQEQGPEEQESADGLGAGIGEVSCGRDDRHDRRIARVAGAERAAWCADQNSAIGYHGVGMTQQTILRPTGGSKGCSGRDPDGVLIH